jgi:two-component system sensor histidine kinase DesK
VNPVNPPPPPQFGQEGPFGSGPLSRGAGWLVSAVWLVFLGQPLGTAWDHRPGFARYLALGALVAFGISYVLLFLWARRSRRLRRPLSTAQVWGTLAGLLGLGALSIPAIGGQSQATLVYIAASAVLLLPRRQALLVVLVLAATPPLASLVIPSWGSSDDIVFAILLGAFASFAVVRLAERNSELVAAQVEIHRLAVAGERARAARDLHDILGHSLTVVAIKAELAGRLLEVDTGRAAKEIAEVERLARDALADVRRTVGAYREVTLATELASARSALSAAGVDAMLPASVEDVPAERSELFGWVVREGVTNVVRHSGARHCTVRVDPDQVEVEDDGRGPTDGESGANAGGHGLLGLRERAEQLGGRLTVGRAGAQRGFRLRVSLPPEDVPVSLPPGVR